METSPETPRVLIIHGPNLNMLGAREPEVYGRATLEEIDAALFESAKRLGLALETFQSNHEGAIVEKIQSAMEKCQGLIINPAAYTHTSVAVRDALLLLNVPIVEVHLSNIQRRESFRHTSLVADIATGRISGFGARGYTLALDGMAGLLQL